MFKDKVIICHQCQQQFVWTAQDQEYFQQKGLVQPRFCLICRSMLKAAVKDKFRGKVRKEK